MRLPIDHQW